MVKLIVDDIWTKVCYEYSDNTALVARDKIYNALGVRADGYFFSRQYRQGQWDGYVRFFNKRKNVFPTGLLGTVKRCLNKNFVEYKIEDLRNIIHRDPNDLDDEVYDGMLKGIRLRDYQIQAIKEAVCRGRGIIFAATNAGKTEIAAGIIKVLNKPSIYLATSRSLVVQTAERLEKRLQKPVRIVAQGIEKNEDSDIVVGTFQTFWSKTTRNIVPEYAKILDVSEVLFLDECHLSTSDEWYKIAIRVRAPYRFGLSGTPFSNDKVRNIKLRACTGDVVFKISNEELIKRGVSSCPIVYFFPIETDQLDLQNAIYETAYQQLIVRNEKRNEKIAEIVEKCIERGEHVLILIKMIEHGEILLDKLIQRNIKCEFIHGQNDITRRKEVIEMFKSGKIQCIIASAIFDQGIDIDNMQNLIIASGGASKVKTLQRLGRALRKGTQPFVNIYDFMDLGNKYLKKHSKKRIESCKDEEFDVRLQKQGGDDEEKFP